MGIKNLTPRLAERGKIKIGGKGEERTSKKTGQVYRIPEKHDYFTIVKNIKGADDLFPVDDEIMRGLSKYADAEDGKIRQLPIILHADEIDDVFPTRYACYSGRKCVCHGDGEQAQRRKKTESGEFTDEWQAQECPCDLLQPDAKGVRRCKPNGKLFCSLVVPGASVAGAVHVWRTTSIISINEMVGSLVQIREVTGFLRGLPLWLRVVPKTVEPNGQPITVYTCHVELREADVLRLQTHALEQRKMRDLLGGDSGYRALLSAPGENETVEEQEAIEAEFYAHDPDEETTPEPPSKPAKGTSPSDVTAALAKKQAKKTAKKSAPPEEPPEMETPPDDDDPDSVF